MTGCLIYMEVIAEGLVEFPTDCPDWSTQRRLSQHGLPADIDGEGIPTADFRRR